MGVLNLPRVTGWGTNQLPGAVNQMMERSHESEIERQKIAQRQQEQAQQQKNQMDNLRIQQESKALQKANIHLRNAFKFSESDDPADREVAKAEFDAANKLFEAMGGKAVPYGSMMEAKDIKKAAAREQFNVIVKQTKNLSVNSKPEQIQAVEANIAKFSSDNKDWPVTLPTKNIDSIKQQQAKAQEINERKKAAQLRFNQDKQLKGIPQARENTPEQQAFANLTPEEQRQKTLQKSATGELTDNAVLQNIREIANFDTKGTARMWNKYLQHKKSGLDRAEALNMVQQEFDTGASKDDYSYLWSK